MFASGFITEELAVRVGWTLIHSLWQIALIGGLFWGINRALERQSANLRYVVGCVAMLLMLVVPVWWLVFMTSTTPVGGAIDSAALSTGEVHPVDRSEFVGWPKSLPTDRRGEIEIHSTSLRVQTASGSKIESLEKWHGTARFIAAIWFIGVLLLLLRPALGFAHAGRLCRVGRADAPESIQRLLHRVAEAMKVRAVIQVAQSTLAKAPCVVGWCRPVILLPAAAVSGLTTAELESILAHELAHIRRHDYLVNLAQMAIETLLFFHPVVWWVSRCVRREREYCCDDLALQVCGDREVLTDALLAVGGVNARSRLAIASDGTVLFERVERILKPNNVNDTASQGPRARIVAVVCLALLAVAWRAFSGSESESQNESPQQQAIAMTSERNEDTSTGDNGDLVQAWSDAINDRDYERVLALLKEHPELGETRFFPREKLKHYHAATYVPSAFATMTDDLELMEAFLKGGVTPNFGTAAESPEMAELVIKYGKQTKGFDDTLSKELFSASWFPNLEIQRILLAAGADPNVRKWNSGIRPLMYVALRSKGEQSLAISRQLIEHGADVNAKSYSGFGEERTSHDGYNHDVEHGHETPLHWAARQGNAPLVQLLLDHGADPDARTTSVRTNHRDEKGSYLFEAGGGETPKDWAYQSGDEATIHLLCGNDALDSVASAARAGLTDRVRSLIRAGEDVNAADSNGRSAIDYALQRRDTELCRILTDDGATWPETITTAIRMGIPSVVNSLLDADPTLKEQTLRDPRAFFMNEFDLDSFHVKSIRAVMESKPESPIDLVLAGYIGDKDAAEAIIAERPDLISKAIAAFPQIACYFIFDTALLERVLDAGADIDARGTPHDYTPLQRAVWTSHLDSVQLLVKRGADVEIESRNRGWRTLDIVCYQSRRHIDHRIIKVLLDAGADPNVEAHNLYTVLDALHHYGKKLTDEEREQAIAWVRAAGGKTHKESALERYEVPGNKPTGVSQLSKTSESVLKQFWEAVCGNDVAATRRLLNQDPSFASRDFRPVSERNPHTDGFPLHKACAMGHVEIAKLLVSHGADVDAVSPTEEQKELGMPLWWAVDRRDYSLANFLLDHGADVGAYAWANATMVERLYEHAVEDGAQVEVVRKGFVHYLGAVEDAPVADDAPESVKLLDRVLSSGGRPSPGSIVQAEYYSLVEELLRKCPEEPGSKHDNPQGNVFESLCNAASWYGRPKVMELAMAYCPHLHSPKHAKRAISRAIISHNRFGSVEDYYALIEAQLKYLKEDGELSSVIEGGSFLPHHKVASDYLWPDHYGYGDSQSSVESMIELSKLLISFGFEPNRVDANGVAPLALAEERRKKDHPGMTEYIAFLKEIDAS